MPKQIVAPPSKSFTHRAFICAGLAFGESFIKNPLISDDTNRTRECLEKLGAIFTDLSDGVKVKGVGELKNFDVLLEFDVGESGTTCRLLIPVVAASKKVEARFYGRGRMHKRPVKDLTDVLEEMGVDFSWEENVGYLPFVMRSHGLDGRKVVIKLDQSSQYLSGLLLASPFAKDKVEIEIGGEKAVSWPYVGITLEVMETFGQKIKVFEKKDNNWIETDYRSIKEVLPGRIKFIVEPRPYKAVEEYKIEGDWSNSSYFIAAGLILKDGISIKGLKKDSLQGDKKILKIIEEMGGRYFWEGENLVIKPSNLKGTALDMGDCPDLVPTVGVLATIAEGTTVIKNVAHLRLKESDRLLGVASEIKKVGAHVEILEDGLKITSKKMNNRGKILFNTYNDHRMAMSLSLYELLGFEVILDNKECVKKSFPNFFKVWENIKRSL